MFSSLRASKVILGKFGTAASFGFGVNAGARYSDSQSGHQLNLEEALLLSSPRMPLHLEEIDVDRSSLYGYACFSLEGGAAQPPAPSPPADLVHSSSSSSSSSRMSNTAPLAAAPSAATARPQRERALPAKQTTHFKHSSAETPRPPRASAPSFPASLRGMDEKLSVPQPLSQAEEARPLLPTCRYGDGVKQQQQQQHFLERLSWSSLVEQHQCSICADLLAGEDVISLCVFVCLCACLCVCVLVVNSLSCCCSCCCSRAVPVVTACQHCFCAICLRDLQDFHRHVSNSNSHEQQHWQWQ